ncbi:MAG: isocitrate lyase/PEP mutase family protein [Negativicutes bacterium]|nr:isocitrate lyase/PEP mutase family protein [Negativicutes bacterium]
MTTRLRELLARKEILVAPGAHDALAAKIVAKAGFEAVYFTGYGQAASHLGGPDVGLLTMTEMVMRARNFAAAVDIPVIADADTGFGNAVNTMRTVREYEAAGVAAVQIEDQVAPKKCGHMTGRQVVPLDEMVGKIRAAVAARQDPDLVIIARTDARTTLGIDEALRRGRAFAEAGADVLFIESPESVDEMRLITSSFQIPVLANMVEGGRTPMYTAAELQELGYELVIFPTSSTYITAMAVTKVMQELKRSGTTRGMMGDMIPFEQFNELVGLPGVREIEGSYLPPKG